MSVNDFNETKDLEVMTFRRNAMAYCKQYVDERESDGPTGLALSIYPPDIHSTSHLPPHITRTIQKGFVISVGVVIHSVYSVCFENWFFKFLF